MTTNRVLILVLACALVCGAEAKAASRLDGLSAAQAQDLSAATRKKKQGRRAARAPRRIACTFLGCHPVPAGCYPRAGFDFWGNPTGFDVIVCPRR